jgi:hypothetical protein
VRHTYRSQIGTRVVRLHRLELPGTISPRAKKVWLIEADEFVRAGFDGYTPIVGSVEHATGTRFLSEPEMLGPANTLVAMLLKHRYQSGFGQRRLNAVDVLVPFGRKHRPSNKG